MVAESNESLLVNIHARRFGIEGRVKTHFFYHPDTNIANLWAGSTPIQDQVSRAVSLVMAAVSPRELSQLVRAQLKEYSTSLKKNARLIFDDAPYDPFIVHNYQNSKQELFTNTESDKLDKEIVQAEEVAVGKSVRGQLEELAAMESVDRRHIAVLLAQMHLLSNGQVKDRRQNLKGRMILLRDLTSEGVSYIQTKRGRIDNTIDTLDEILSAYPEPVYPEPEKPLDILEKSRRVLVDFNASQKK